MAVRPHVVARVHGAGGIHRLVRCETGQLLHLRHRSVVLGRAVEPAGEHVVRADRLLHHEVLAARVDRRVGGVALVQVEAADEGAVGAGREPGELPRRGVALVEQREQAVLEARREAPHVELELRFAAGLLEEGAHAADRAVALREAIAVARPRVEREQQHLDLRLFLGERARRSECQGECEHEKARAIRSHSGDLLSRPNGTSAHRL